MEKKNYTKSIEYFKSGAKYGDSFALTSLGQIICIVLELKTNYILKSNKSFYVFQLKDCITCKWNCAITFSDDFEDQLGKKKMTLKL